jgi:hypothetical protein
MTIARPQNREEFKEHVLMRLGKPVLEINVADEQLDICIEEGFQYFHERSHYDGNERVYISVDLNNANIRDNYSSYNYQLNTNENLVPEVTHRTGMSQNFIMMPDDVTGVTKVMRPSRGYGMGGGILPPGFIFPGIIGSISGNGCDNSGFGLTQYYAFKEFMALIEFMMFPPKMYRFNQRTHRLWIDGNLNDLSGMLVCEAMVKPNPDIFPDLWNDGWLKLYTTALVKKQWGTNLTKYNQVQLPGGITLNGEKIYNDAAQELDTIRQRFAMDEADVVLDEVG